MGGEMGRKVIWLAMALLLVAMDVSAEMYKYLDDQGVLHFAESLNAVPKKHRRNATVAGKGGSVSYAEPGLPNPAAKGTTKTLAQEKTAFTGTVEIYMTSWCPACKAALAYVKRNGIAHIAYDIEKDNDANRRFEGFNGRGVPLIIVGDKAMHGFDSRTLERWLGR
jgi:glutaredoxin